MKADLAEIIRKLDHIQDLLHQNRHSEAGTAVYEAQSLVEFLRDTKL